MNRRRNGSTILETMLVVGLVSVVATLSVTLIQLGNRTYIALLDDSLESKNVLRFASDFRDWAHRSTKVTVSQSLDMLRLESEQGIVTEYRSEPGSVSVLQSDGQQTTLRESYHFAKSNAQWKFSYDAEQAVVGAHVPGNNNRIVIAAIGVMASTDPNAKPDGANTGVAGGVEESGE